MVLLIGTNSITSRQYLAIKRPSLVPLTVLRVGVWPAHLAYRIVHGIDQLAVAGQVRPALEHPIHFILRRCLSSACTVALSESAVLAVLNLMLNRA